MLNSGQYSHKDIAENWKTINSSLHQENILKFQSITESYSELFKVPFTFFFSFPSLLHRLMVFPPIQQQMFQIHFSYLRHTYFCQLRSDLSICEAYEWVVHHTDPLFLLALSSSLFFFWLTLYEIVLFNPLFDSTSLQSCFLTVSWP